ncbi:MAG: NAD(P)H-dependent oxidoreductase [Methanobrevibacter thaueri]|nr:NAD(P)H-dependent oxidoreductase [Methanobrevibacter thaueri]
MKYLIINGSPRKKNTWNVVKQARKNLKGEFEEIHLIKEEIPLCKGCFNCINNGEDKCPHADKIKPIMDKIRKCDGLIITSPVYALNITAILKNLFDHTAFLFHRPEFFTKKALVAVTTAGAGHKKCANYIDETLRHWGFNKVYKIPLACGGNETFSDKNIKKINKISKKFAKDMESEKIHSPKLMDIIFFNAWKALALSKHPIEADEKYWNETGLINMDFAPEVKLNIFKKIFSKIMFFIIKQVIK